MSYVVKPEPLYTVVEALAFLKLPAPMRRGKLSKLGRDCTLYARTHNLSWIDRPVQGKDWPTERAYPVAVIREVFRLNPDTRDYVPQETPANV